MTKALRTTDKESFTDKLNSVQKRQSMKLAIMSAVLAIIWDCCGGGKTLALLAIKLGAEELYVGILGFALQISMLLSVLTYSAIEHKGKRTVMIKWLGISGIFTAIVIFIPLTAEMVNRAFSLGILLILAFCMRAAFAMGQSGWFPLLHDFVPKRLTGRFFGRLRTSWHTSLLIGFLFIAFFLQKDPPWWKFSVLFGIAAGATGFRLLTFINIAEKKPRTDKLSKVTLFERFRDVLSNKDMRAYAILLSSLAMLTVPTIPFQIKLLKNLDYSEKFIMVGMAVLSVGAIVSMTAWGKLADKFGNRHIYTICLLGMPVVMLGWAGVDSGKQFYILLLFFLFNLINSGVSIANTRYMMGIVPADKQNRLNIFRMFVFICAAFASMFFGLFLHVCRGVDIAVRVGEAGFNVNNYDLMFMIIAAGYIVPFILSRKLKQSGDRRTTEVVGIALRPLASILPSWTAVLKKGDKYRGDGRGNEKNKGRNGSGEGGGGAK
jgi:MFS family permease